MTGLEDEELVWVDELVDDDGFEYELDILGTIEEYDKRGDR